MAIDSKYFGRVIKQRRLMANLSLRQLGAMSGLSSSHLGRIEKGVRFPSARTVRKISKPLDFRETELLQLAGLLSYDTLSEVGDSALKGNRRLDPGVGMILAQEPLEVQRAVIGILYVLKTIAKPEVERQ